jgi:hypothetical protein
MYSELFEITYYECNLKPLFEQILREEHLREMSKVSPYLFAHGLQIAFSKGIMVIKNAIQHAIGLLKGGGSDKMRDKFAPYYSNPKNSKKTSDIPVERTIVGITKFADSSIAAYERNYGNIPVDKKDLRDESIKEISNELEIH